MQNTLDANTEAFYTQMKASCVKIRSFESITHTPDEAVANFKKAHLELEIAKENLERARDTMIELSNGESVILDGVEITHFTQKGLVDYKAIPELQGVDLDKYRKGASVRTRVALVV
jgi:hypothetical protein